MVEIRSWSGVFCLLWVDGCSCVNISDCSVNTEYYAGKGWRGGLKICPLVSQLETGRQVPYRQGLVQSVSEVFVRVRIRILGTDI